MIASGRNEATDEAALLVVTFNLPNGLLDVRTVVEVYGLKLTDLCMVRCLNEASNANRGNGSDGSAIFVNNAQALQLGKGVIAVDIFSIFGARLQYGLNRVQTEAR